MNLLLKQELINQVLIHEYYKWRTAIRYGLSNLQYKKNDYTVVEKTRERPKLMIKNIQKDKTNFEKLQEENLRLAIENCICFQFLTVIIVKLSLMISINP